MCAVHPSSLMRVHSPSCSAVSTSIRSGRSFAATRQGHAPTATRHDLLKQSAALMPRPDGQGRFGGRQQMRAAGMHACLHPQVERRPCSRWRARRSTERFNGQPYANRQLEDVYFCGWGQLPKRGARCLAGLGRPSKLKPFCQGGPHPAPPPRRHPGRHRPRPVQTAASKASTAACGSSATAASAFTPPTRSSR